MTELVFALLQILLGWLLADFLTGLVHWIEDRFGPGREHWPILGPLVFAPNQRHHREPAAFTFTAFFARNWTNWAAALPLGAVLFWLFGSHPWIWSALVGGAFANEVHAWAHRRTLLPLWLRMPIGWLQALGLVQSPAHHAGHHVPPFRRRYCVLTDWLNPLLDSVKFWSLLEAFLPRGWFREGVRLP